MIKNIFRDDKGFYIHMSLEEGEDNTIRYLSLWDREAEFKMYLTDEQLREILSIELHLPQQLEDGPNSERADDDIR